MQSNDPFLINLGQGFPDFACDPALVSMVGDAMRAGRNQYPMMTGAPQLREAVAAKIATLYGKQYCAAGEITITAGATQAVTTAILCCVHAGDECSVETLLRATDGKIRRSLRFRQF